MGPSKGPPVRFGSVPQAPCHKRFKKSIHFVLAFANHRGVCHRWHASTQTMAGFILFLVTGHRVLDCIMIRGIQGPAVFANVPSLQVLATLTLCV